MLTWSDIRAIDAIADPIGVLSVYVDRPDAGAGRLVRAVSLAGELRRLEREVIESGHADAAAAVHQCLHRIRPALAGMLDGRSPGRALYAPVSGEEVYQLAVGLPVGVTATLEPTAYVRPLVAAFDEGRPAGVMVTGATAVQLFEWRMGRVEEVGECAVAGARLGRVRTAVAAAGIAREVDGLAAERGWRRVLVAGGSGLAHALAHRAAGSGREVAIATGLVDGLPPRAIAVAVAADLHAAQRRYEQRLAERVVAAALSDGTAVLGAGRTLEALGGGAVSHLLLDGERDYRWSGALTGSRGPAGLDPAETLIELALHGGADITPLEGPSRATLTESDGVAAVLRS